MKKKEDTSAYSEEEIVKAIEVFRMLQKKRDDLIRQGLWDTAKGCPIDPAEPKSSNDSSDDSSK